MKLVFAIVHSEDAGKLVEALTEKEYRVTRLQS
ncbi:MAG: cyclic-di-AMP receptor, partial [Chloroflexota bacterium]|nr:cyclic-di-AMP receptor [Chloroflexota bacterium]